MRRRCFCAFILAVLPVVFVAPLSASDSDDRVTMALEQYESLLNKKRAGRKTKSPYLVNHVEYLVRDRGRVMLEAVFDLRTWGDSVFFIPLLRCIDGRLLSASCDGVPCVTRLRDGWYSVLSAAPGDHRVKLLFHVDEIDGSVGEVLKRVSFLGPVSGSAVLRLEVPLGSNLVDAVPAPCSFSCKTSPYRLCFEAPVKSRDQLRLLWTCRGASTRPLVGVSAAAGVFELSGRFELKGELFLKARGGGPRRILLNLPDGVDALKQDVPRYRDYYVIDVDGDDDIIRFPIQPTGVIRLDAENTPGCLNLPLPRVPGSGIAFQLKLPSKPSFIKELACHADGGLLLNPRSPAGESRKLLEKFAGGSRRGPVINFESAQDERAVSLFYRVDRVHTAAVVKRVSAGMYLGPSGGPPLVHVRLDVRNYSAGSLLLADAESSSLVAAYSDGVRVIPYRTSSGLCGIPLTFFSPKEGTVGKVDIYYHGCLKDGYPSCVLLGVRELAASGDSTNTDSLSSVTGMQGLQAWSRSAINMLGFGAPAVDHSGIRFVVFSSPDYIPSALKLPPSVLPIALTDDDGDGDDFDGGPLRPDAFDLRSRWILKIFNENPEPFFLTVRADGPGLRYWSTISLFLAGFSLLGALLVPVVAFKAPAAGGGSLFLLLGLLIFSPVGPSAFDAVAAGCLTSLLAFLTFLAVRPLDDEA